MKRLVPIVTVVSLCLAAGSVGWIARAAEEEAKQEEHRLALKGQDPIELINGKTVKGNEELSAVHKKFRYLFANAKNQEKFQSNPDRYGIQGDGQCIVYPDAPADPSIFTVYQGKIYAFATEQCVVRFNEDPKRYL